jgi:hypothetical protein
VEFFRPQFSRSSTLVTRNPLFIIEVDIRAPYLWAQRTTLTFT